MSSTLVQGVLVGLIPSLSMLGASFLLSTLKIPGKVEAFFQYFAVGLILTVVGASLIPDILDLEEHTAASAIVGVTIGFPFGLVTIHGVNKFVEVYFSTKEDDNSKLHNPLLEHEPNNYRTTFSLNSANIVARSREKSENMSQTSIPTSILMPVIINALVDGFLIGLTVADDPSTGYVVAAALSVEMAFVGIALTVCVYKSSASTFLKRIVIVTPPVVLFLFTVLGAAVGEAARKIDILFVAVIAFSTVSLLFLVCDELIPAARVNEGEHHSPLISSAIFMGSYVVIFLNLYV